MNINRVYAGKTALITGGTGFIGSNLARALLRTNVERVVLVDDRSSSFEWNIPLDERINFISGSILDDNLLKKVFSEGFNFVFHLAALFANQNSIEHPEKDLLVNGLGTLKVLEHVRSQEVERFVYTSSSGVYGGESRLPLKENSVKLSLDTPYQITKLLGELYCAFFWRQYGLPVVNLRLFNVYGPGEVPGRYRNVVPNFIYWSLRGEALPITGTGQETRDFTFVDDVVDGILLAGCVEKAVSKTINIATGTETKIIDVAEMINELTESSGGVTFLPKRSWDKVDRKRASIETAQRILGFKPRIDLRTGLQKTIEWFKNNKCNIEKSVSF